MTREEKAMKWIEALRSGEYKQTHGLLQDEHGMCCLGVLCKISGAPLTLDISGKFLLGENLLHQPAAKAWAKDLFADAPIGPNFLASLNDYGHDGTSVKSDGPFTFDEIADVIQAIVIEKVLE